MEDSDGLRDSPIVHGSPYPVYTRYVSETGDRPERRGRGVVDLCWLGLLRKHAQALLRLGQTVILEFGFWARSERDEKRLGARALGLPVELHYLAAPIDELCRRLEARNGVGEPGTVPASRELLEEYVKFFQAPDDDELGLFDEPPPGRRG
ncbi:AAA family ATPase [Nonomuraea sp. NPDC005983]|uniref:AAA family ATPase n=1 Tax=Nonomuraea sp. NPDC005983 TaxID=3155595 RepID=UPI00339F527B